MQQSDSQDIEKARLSNCETFGCLLDSSASASGKIELLSFCKFANNICFTESSFAPQIFSIGFAFRFGFFVKQKPPAQASADIFAIPLQQSISPCARISVSGTLFSKTKESKSADRIVRPKRRFLYQILILTWWRLTTQMR